CASTRTACTAIRAKSEYNSSCTYCPCTASCSTGPHMQTMQSRPEWPKQASSYAFTITSFQFLAFSPMSPMVHGSVDSHPGNTQDGPGDYPSRGRECRHHECPDPKYANASGSRRRMTPVSRPDPVLRFVRSRQRFVRRCQPGPPHGAAVARNVSPPDCAQPLAG